LKPHAFDSMDAALLDHMDFAAVLVNDELRVREVRGDLGKLSVSATIGRTLRGQLAERIRALAREGGGAWQEADLRVTVKPLTASEADPLYCVIFESLAVERELEIARESLATLVEESEAATEELRSAVEELRSANHELQELNAELTSSNQEVARLNARLEARAKELERANAELVSVIEGLRMPIVVLGADLRVKRFTGPAERALGLRPSHVGKRVADVEALKALQTDCAIVMTTREPLFREFAGQSGRMVQAMIRPFVSDEDQTNAVLLAIVPRTAGAL
jgi:two-component system CheB/CheR fusion protein